MASYDYTLKQGIWDTRYDHMDFPDPEQIKQLYKRARMICQHSGITVDDVVEMKPNFWKFNRHPVAMSDTAVSTILAIHWNLCIGTIGKFARERQDLKPLLQDLQSFNVCGEFLLTEVGHGLDVRNLETVATLQPDGSFDLHTPNKSAAKIMPPTTPLAGIPRVGVVFARLIASEVDCGVRPFIVKLTDSDQMCPGITSRPLPRRIGSKPLDHAITTFYHVRLSPGSLLGSLNQGPNKREEFFEYISRVSVGTLLLSMYNITALYQSAFIVGTYSIRRHVAGSAPGQKVPIISFATQYKPILNAIAQASVFNAFADEAIALFQDDTLSHLVRNGVAACFKATTCLATQITLNELADRCGWQGLFAYNRILEMGWFMRGIGIAEGDYTVLCIRLASEILLGRYELPPARMKNCLLARHEAGVWKEAREMVESLGPGNHRDQPFNAYILPRCRVLVESTGHRMAYEAAVSGGKVTQGLLSLFESICVMSDLSWYCENGAGSRKDFFAREVEAVEAVLPQLPTLLDETKAASWTTVPIVNEKLWDDFVESLPVFRRGETISEKSHL
ncbi:putative acyl-CoA oxidase [Hypoxylon sp. FL1857]|nr:putative acyl-CoA oxidase [Hypoxylon sp. FL1857]